jgi:predicted nucleic acid-binding protein
MHIYTYEDYSEHRRRDHEKSYSTYRHQRKNGPGPARAGSPNLPGKQSPTSRAWGNREEAPAHPAKAAGRLIAMVLVDTSVWVDHLRTGVPRLAELLERGDVLVHPFIIGELACGRMTKRTEILGLLRTLPHAQSAIHDEALQLVEDRKLMGRGLGYIDVHLLASALLSSCRLWTTDASLRKASEALGIDAP